LKTLARWRGSWAAGAGGDWKSAGAVQRVEPLFNALTEAGIEYVTFSVSGEPTLDVARTGTQRARDEKCDLVIGFGGGA